MVLWCYATAERGLDRGKDASGWRLGMATYQSWPRKTKASKWICTPWCAYSNADVTSYCCIGIHQHHRYVDAWSIWCILLIDSTSQQFLRNEWGNVWITLLVGASAFHCGTMFTVHHIAWAQSMLIRRVRQFMIVLFAILVYRHQDHCKHT